MKTITAIVFIATLSLLAGCKGEKEPQQTAKPSASASASFGPAYGQSKPLYEADDKKK